MKKLFVIAFFTYSSFHSYAQYNVLLNFDSANGANPVGTLLLSGNFLYGMTGSGGANDSGCVFRIDTNGNQYQDLFDFNGSNGKEPIGSLILSGKELYGMTPYGGTYSRGNIFSIDTNGNGYRNLFDFNGINGGAPRGSLALSGSRLYGVTTYGGISDSGVVFSIDTDGSRYKDLFDFNGATGKYPCGTLTLSLSGNVLYGMTNGGGLYGFGIIFSIDTNGNRFRDLLDFNGNNGGEPIYNSLTLWRNRLYAMASSNFIFSIDTDGSGYEDLYNFTAGMGFFNTGTLTLDGSVLYGMTQYGGRYDNGVMFSIDTTGGGYADLYDFSGPYGYGPANGLAHSKNVLYGMTSIGGTSNDGVVFSYSEVGLGVKEIPNDFKTVKVFPNPNSGIFTISLGHAVPMAIEIASSAAAEQPIIEIYNVLGAQVYYATLKQVQGDNIINLTGQPNGIYFYRVLSENTTLIGSGKIIIEK